MSYLKLILNTASNYYYFKKEILQHYKEGKPESFIYLLPVNRAVRYFKQQLFAEVESKGIIDPNIFTFNSLIQTFFRNIYPSTKIINNTIRILILNDVLSSLQSSLNFTNKKTGLSKSLIRKIDKVINELKEFGYDLAGEKSNELDKIIKIPDFNLILGKIDDFYNNDQFPLIDESGLLGRTVSELNQELFKKLFPKVEKIYINGYGIYTPPMLEFIRKVKSWCSVEVMLEYNPKNPELFHNTVNACEALNTMADKIDTGFDGTKEIEQHLYKFDSGLQNKIEVRGKIVIHEALNREQEISIIAAKIKELHFNEKVPLHKMGITFPNLESYFNTIKSVFNEFEIPVNISTGYPLLNSYLIKSYLQVLKIINTGFSVNEIVKLFLSPFYKSSEEIDFNAVKKIVVRLKLTHIRGNWQLLFDNLIQQEKMRFASGLPVIAIQSFKNELKRLLEILSQLGDSQSVSEFYENFLGVLKKCGLFVSEDTINKVLNTKESEKEFRAFNKFIQLFDQLKWALQTIYSEKKFSLQEYYYFLHLVIEEATYSLREWPNFGVQVMPRLEIQSTEPEYLFVGGLVEGDFPRKFARDIFFNDEEREILGLNASEDLLSQDRFLFYQLITSKAKKIVLSYPQYLNESVIVSSGFLYNLEKICHIERQKPPLPESYLSANKIIEHVGRKIHEGVNDTDIQYFNMWTGKKEGSRSDLLLDDLTILLNKRSRQQITSYEGNLTNNPDIQSFIKNYYSDKSFSITALEAYAFCPMNFFMQRILNLEKEEEIEITITPMERGNLIHTILFKFFMQLKTQKQHTQPWNHVQLLIDIAKQEFDEINYQGLLWELEKEIYFGNAIQKGLWRKFLEVELDEFNRSGFKPSFFETQFGSFNQRSDSGYKSVPFSISHKKEIINLFGKIDRIDIDDKGNTIIYDYKTGVSGMNINFNDIFFGISLQLPVYLAAAKEVFKTLNLNPDVIAGGYYLVKDADNCQRKTVFADVEKKPEIKIGRNGGKLPNTGILEDGTKFGIDELIARTQSYIINYIDELYNGNFRHTKYPNQLQCSKYCDFRMICRKDVGKITTMKEEE